MSNWNSILSRDNSKILGFINLSNDSFTGDGVFNHDEGLKKLLQSAKQKDIDFIEIGCASSKPGFDSVTTEEESDQLALAAIGSGGKGTSEFKNKITNKFGS